MMINKALHILFLTPSYPPFPGGGERYVRSLAHSLAKQGHKLTIITTQAQLEKAFWQGSQTQTITTHKDGPIKLIRCPIPAWRGGRRALLAWRKSMVLASMLPGQQTAVLQRMARYIPPIHGLEDAFAQVKAIDIVHGFNLSWEHLLVVGSAFAQQHHLPWVVTPFAHLGSKPKDRVALNSTMDHQKQFMQKADALLTLTQVESDGLKNWGITPSYTAVIGGGIDPIPTYPPPKTIVSKHQLTPPFALMVGRMSYDKGVMHAAQAVCTLAQQGAPITLALMGQSTPEFESFYGQLTTQERQHIRPLGILSDKEKHALLEAAAVLLLPSRSDSFGIVILEAWAHATPVIGARAGGIPGVVEEGQNGLLVPFGDVPALTNSLQYLLTHPDIRQQMGENGRHKVQTQYIWQHVGQRVAKHYKELLLKGKM